jgi:hypothetical protein
VGVELDSDTHYSSAWLFSSFFPKDRSPEEPCFLQSNPMQNEKPFLGNPVKKGTQPILLCLLLFLHPGG